MALTDLDYRREQASATRINIMMTSDSISRPRAPTVPPPRAALAMYRALLEAPTKGGEKTGPRYRARSR